MLLWNNAMVTYRYRYTQSCATSISRFTYFESTENSSCKFLLSSPWMTEPKYSSRTGMNGKTSSIPFDLEVGSCVCWSFSRNKLVFRSPESSSIVSQACESCSVTSIFSSSSVWRLPPSCSCAHSKLMTISMTQLHTFWLTPGEKRHRNTWCKIDLDNGCQTGGLEEEGHSRRREDGIGSLSRWKYLWGQSFGFLIGIENLFPKGDCSKMKMCGGGSWR